MTYRILFKKFHFLFSIKGSLRWQHLCSKPDQPSPSVDVTCEEQATQNKVKLAEVEAVAVTNGEEVPH
jgi:hypothetical protein